MFPHPSVEADVSTLIIISTGAASVTVVSVIKF
jgi:hypothetical protein